MHVRGYENTSASAILNRVHQQLYRRYAKQAYSDTKNNNKKNAQLLQDFLQAWKEYANTGFSSDSVFTELLLAPIQQTLGHQLFKFKTSGGLKFEQEMSKFILTLMNNEALGAKLNESFSSALDKTMVGDEPVRSSKSGTYNLIDLQDLANKFLAVIYTTMDSALSENVKIAYDNLLKKIGNAKNQFIQEPQVAGKTDISAQRVEFTITSEAPEILQKIVKLLARSKFTAKNYSSSDWAIQRAIMQGRNPNQLGIGNSDVWRAVVATLSALGYKMNAIKGVYYSAYASGDASAQLHLYHIRFVYELTGLGQNYVKKELQALSEAEFLIYNDPNSTDIYVRSTADLILEMMSEVFDGDWQQKVTISKKSVARKT